MFSRHSRSVQRRVGDDFDGSVVLHNGTYSMFRSGCSNSISAHRANAQRHHADGPAKRHASQHIALPSRMRRVVLVEVLLDDLTLLAGVVDRRCGHGHADGRHAQGEGDRNTRHCRRGGSAGDKARVVLPFPLELFRREAVALFIVGLEVERHLGICSWITHSYTYNSDDGSRREMRSPEKRIIARQRTLDKHPHPRPARPV